MTEGRKGPDPLAVFLSTIFGTIIGACVGATVDRLDPLRGAIVGGFGGGAVGAGVSTAGTWRSESDSDDIFDELLDDADDPTMLFDRADIQARHLSRAVPVHGSGPHRAERITARDGIIRADRGRVLPE